MGRKRDQLAHANNSGLLFIFLYFLLSLSTIQICILVEGSYIPIHIFIFLSHLHSIFLSFLNF
jgi:hypothetical protein